MARYTPWHFIELVERHRIAYHEKELGQLFCDESSKQIVTLLLDECAAAGVDVRTQCSIEHVARTDGGGFLLRTSLGAFNADALVVASGGLSIPSMGASGFGYTLAKQFGHEVLPTRAGLVPLTLTGKHAERLQDLAGVSLPVAGNLQRRELRNYMLVTHRGISGPSILQISSTGSPGTTCAWTCCPDGRIALALLQAWQRERRDAELKTLLAEVLPQALRPAPVRTLDQQQAAAAIQRTRTSRYRQHVGVVATGCQRYRRLPHLRSDPGRRGYRSACPRPR